MRVGKVSCGEGGLEKDRSGSGARRSPSSDRGSPVTVAVAIEVVVVIAPARDVASRHVRTRADVVVGGEKDDKAAVEKKKRRVATSAPLLWPPPHSDAATFMCERPPPVHAAAARAAAAVCPRADIECPTELTPRTATAAANLRKVNCLILGTDVSANVSPRTFDRDRP